MLKLKSEFDEERYLNQNPDVKNSVVPGSLSPAWRHFMLYGFAENRQGACIVPDKLVEFFRAKAPKGNSPPSNLRKRVHGDDSASRFFSVGKGVAADLQLVLDKHGIIIPKNSNILDFGVGCGRVLPWLAMLYPDANYFGTDIDKEAIEWDKANLSNIAKFSVNGATPPTEYKNKQFDLVVCISIFTHLPEDMHLSWIAELARITKPNGILAISLHGRKIIDKLKDPDLPRKNREEFLQRGFTYVLGSGTDGLPGFYQNAYQDDHYIMEKWGGLFTTVDVVKGGLNGHQDLVLCIK